jgi:hypothetical protein
MRKLIPSILSVAIVIFGSGCSVFRGSRQKVTITYQPADAVLMVNHQRYLSPATIKLPRNRAALIECHKPGYTEYRNQVENHLNFTGALDAIGSILILPMIGLCTPGAFSLDETEFNIVLYPEPPQPAAPAK